MLKINKKKTTQKVLHVFLLYQKNTKLMESCNERNVI